MATLVYDFKTIGENVVHTALASIERRVAAHNARMRREFGGGARPGVVSATAGAARVRSSADAVAKAEQRAAAQATLYWQKAAQKSADFRMRQEERAHKARQRQIEAEAKAQRRAADSEERRRRQAEARQFRAVERHAMRERRERAGVARNVLGRSGRSVAGTLGTVAGVAGTAIGLAGTFAVGSALQTRIAESAQASRLANQAGAPELKGELLRESQNVRGFAGSEVMGGLEAFVEKTGDLETARKVMGDLGNLALATGADLSDLGRTAGQAFLVLADQIDDPAERLKELKALMGALAQQGAMGAVEMRDLAREFGKLGAATRAFEGGAPDLLRSMGAFAQIAVARGGAAGPAEAATAASRLASDMVVKQGRFKKLGVDVVSSTDRTKLRSPEQIMLDVLEKTGGDVTKTTGLFGMESVKIFRGMGATFSAAEAKEKGSGRKAALAEFERFAGAKLDAGSIQARAESRLADPDLVLKENTKKFNAAIGTELLPVLTRMVPEFTKMIPQLAKAAEFFAKLVEGVAKDPWGALIKVIAAKLVLDLASAGIGAAVKNKLVGMIGGFGAGGQPVPAGVGVPGGKGGFLGKPTVAGALGAAGLGLGIGTMVAAGIETAGIAKFEAGEANIEAGGQKLNQVRALSAGSSAQDFMAARDAVDALHAQARDAQKTDIFDDAMNLFGASNKHVEAKSLQDFANEAEATLRQKMLEAQQAAAAQQKQAATEAGETFKKAVTEASQKLALNRGNTPAPPVP